MATEEHKPDEQNSANSAVVVRTELIGGQVGSFIRSDRGLPQTIDDAELLFGDKVYDRMLVCPEIQGLFNGIRSAVLEQGFLVSPGVEKPLPSPDGSVDPGEQTRYDQASEIADFVNDQLDRAGRLGRGFFHVLWESMNCLVKGHVLFEVTYEDLESGKWKGKRGLQSIKPKPRQNYSLVVDSYNNLLGVTARQPGRQYVIRTGYIGDATQVPSFIGRSKLMVFSWDVKDDDPRGTSLLRGCYRPWSKLELTDPEEVSYAVQFGSGRLFYRRGSADSSNVGVSKESNEDIATKLEGWGPGGVFVGEPESEATVVMPDTDTKIFINLREEIRRQFALAMTTSVRAFLEAQHGSKADAAQADNLLDSFIGIIHKHIEPVVQQMLIRVLVDMNYPELEEEFYPVFTMNAGGSDSLVEVAGAIKDLVDAGFITEEMKPYVARDRLGIEYHGNSNPGSEDASGLKQ